MMKRQALQICLVVVALVCGASICPTIVGQIEAVLSLNFTNYFWKISQTKFEGEITCVYLLVLAFQDFWVGVHILLVKQLGKIDQPQLATLLIFTISLKQLIKQLKLKWTVLDISFRELNRIQHHTKSNFCLKRYESYRGHRGQKEK